MSLPATYTVRENDLSFRVLDGEAVIISSGTGYYYSLNRSGTMLWNLLLDGGRAAGPAAEALATFYGADCGAVLADVEKLLELLVTENLVAEASAGAAPGATNGHPAGAADHPYEQPQLVKFDKLQRLMVCGE